ncbi:hypothetical protein GHT06_008970 [Daphnia sinensis]|uniref:Uncharacterized protein n=1 Tax=Daphnia sinensis TaxID=1820382 RepID=A0AAD5LMW3_9CRUS|nr:hypothetical protein GHT06_008970 [Daphnia sinensis]
MIKSVQLFLDGDEEEEDINFDEDELDINNDEEEEKLTLAMLARLLELRYFITEIENCHADVKISEIQSIGILDM